MVCGLGVNCSYKNFEMVNALGVHGVDNEVLNDADQYLREHKILELFEVRNCSF